MAKLFAFKALGKGANHIDLTVFGLFDLTAN